MGTIVHGNKNFGYAPITASSGGVMSFGTPVMLSGGVSADVETDQSTQNIYADNTAYCTILGTKVRTATLTFRHVPSAYLEYLGFKATANGGAVDTGKHEKHCIFFQTDEYDDNTGLNVPTLHYLYAAIGKEPSQSSETDEDEVSAQEFEVEYSCGDSEIAKDAEGNPVQYFKITRSTANATLFDSFKTQVILPTSTN